MTRTASISTFFFLALLFVALIGPAYIIIDVLTGIDDDPAAQAVARIGAPLTRKAPAADVESSDAPTLDAQQ